MKVIIIGAGFTGVQLARLLVNEKNDVTIIDNNEDITKHISSSIDCTVISSDGNDLKTLEEAGIAKADALIALTSSDEINIITCSLVDAVYPNILKIARVRNYAYYINSTTATETHKKELQGQHRPLYGIDYMVHPDVEAASAIVEAVSAGAISNIITFQNSSYQISKIKINSGSVFSGLKLMDIRKVTKTKILITYIEEGSKVSLPQGSSILTPGSFIGVLSQKEDLKEVLELCGATQKELKKIAIIGAGRIGCLIAERLLKPKKNTFFDLFFNRNQTNASKIAIIDNNEVKIKKAAERFPDCLTYYGDATDEAFLVEEGLPSYDLVICSTHNHELNMILSAYLEGLGVGQSISLVTSSAFVGIALNLGVDVAVSLRDVVVDSIMSHMRGSYVKEVHTIGSGGLEIIECEIELGSKVIGVKIKDLLEHGKYLVLLDKHKEAEEYELTTGETVIKAGDHLVLITLNTYTKHIISMFSN